MTHVFTEFKAGAVVAIAGFCQAFIYGLLAFSPLGAQGLAYAMYAGLGSAVLGGFVGVLLGKAPAQFGGPRGSTSFITASTLALVLQTPGFNNPSNPLQLHAALLVVALQLMLSGVALWVAQRQGLGKAMMYVPAPVLIGLNTMVGLFTFYSLIPALVGFAVYTKPAELVHLWPGISGAALGLSLCIGGTMLGFRLWRPTPLGTLYGLLVGVGVYMALLGFTPLGNSVGPTAGTLPAWPWAGLLQQHTPEGQGVLTYTALHLLKQPALLGQLVLASIISASIILIESMCAHLMADQQLGHRHNTAHELNVLALSNVLSGLFLTLPVSNFSNRTSAGLAMGTRSRLSDGTYALAIVVYGALLWSVWWGIPVLVVAAISGISSLLSIQGGTYKLFVRQITQWFRPADALTPNEKFTLWVIVAMLTTAGLFNLLAGVLMGVVFVAIYFLRQQTSSGLSLLVHNPAVRSRTQRSPTDNAVLNHAFQKLVWAQFESNFYFANAPQVVMRLQDELAQAQWVLLDFTRLRYIDDTGLDNLQRLLQHCTKNRLRVCVSSPIKPTETGGFVAWQALVRKHAHNVCVNNEEAFWTIENAMLNPLGSSSAPTVSPNAALPAPDLSELTDVLNAHPAWTSLSPQQAAVLAQHWQTVVLEPQHTLFERGQPADGLYLVLRGQLSAWLDTGLVSERLMRFNPSSLVGEMALLDGQPRSARVAADEASLLLHLSQKAFQDLQLSCPQAVQSLLQHLALTMAQRLRLSNQALSLTASA